MLTVTTPTGDSLCSMANDSTLRRSRSPTSRSPSGLQRGKSIIPDRAELAVKALTEMVRGGFCTPQVVSGVTRYEFPQLVGTVLVRRCGHCGWEAPLMSQASVCAQCGAPVKTGRASDDEAIGLH
jgi:hypothetical protein